MSTTPLPVRLSDDLIARIDSVASHAGLNRSDVIRLCLTRFLDDFEGDPAELLNRNWGSVLDKFDGRKTRYSSPANLNENLENEHPLTVEVKRKKVVKSRSSASRLKPS